MRNLGILKDLPKTNQNDNILSYKLFLNICQQLLAPEYLKNKNVSDLIAAHLWKEPILKTIMDWSRLRNKFLKTRSKKDKRAYNTQRNYYLTLVGKGRED